MFRFRKPISKLTYSAIATMSVLGCIVVWEVVVRIGLFPEDFFPGPFEVWQTAVEMFQSKDFLRKIIASCGRIAVAFFASAILAIPIGVLMSSYKSVEALLEPIIDFVRYVPVPALLPVFVLWAGIGEGSKFLVLFFGTFFQLVLLIMDDADNVPPAYFDVTKTMGASDGQLLRDILVPYMLPQIYDRLRITLGWCWTYLVIAELIAVELGVGHAIKEAQRFNASDQLFVCCIVLGLIGLSTDYIAKTGYRMFFPYADKSKLHK